MFIVLVAEKMKQETMFCLPKPDGFFFMEVNIAMQSFRAIFKGGGNPPELKEIFFQW
jgi:hypothetical protein